MPRLKKFDPASLLTPAMQEKMVEFVEREIKGMADVGISMLADAVKQRLSRPRPARASTAPRQDWNGRVHEPDTPAEVSPYQVLGVSPEAPIKEVELAFDRKVMACHPDRGGDEEELRRVLEAMRQIRSERKP